MLCPEQANLIGTACLEILWSQHCSPTMDLLDAKDFRAIRAQFFKDQAQAMTDNSDSLLLSALRPELQVVPILWLPMTNSERSRFIR